MIELPAFSMRPARRHEPLSRPHGPRPSEAMIALYSILGFWGFYGITALVRASFVPTALASLDYRLINMGIGMILSGVIYWLIRSLARDGSMLRMGIAASLGIFPAAAFTSFIVRWFEYDRRPFDPLIAIDEAGSWYFLFAAWSALYIAIVEQQRVRDAEVRVAEAETAAQSAQLRALQYQINPHFLFNTLNSLSSLMMSGRAERAEEMLLALSTFLRTSLSLEPSREVSLTEEIALQRLYLDIEKVRFPDRLVVAMEVPDALGEARLPAMILQPLVENAIKYGVSSAADPVRVTIRAKVLDGGRMEIDVLNQRIADEAPVEPPILDPMACGIGLGLTNVRERLHAHYGPDGDVRCGPIAGGYKVSLAIPLKEEE